MSNILVFVLELIGTVAFAVSGAIVGIKKQMDLLGVIVLGVCTAVGGGIVRDLILGITPPATFQDPVYTLTAAAVSVLMFLPHVRARVGRHEPVFDRLLLVMDAVGLGVFTVVGVQCAYRQTEHYTLFLTVFVGLITGVGGGVLRDVFSGERPYIFVRHFYACASIIGAQQPSSCCACWQHITTGACRSLTTTTIRRLPPHCGTDNSEAGETMMTNKKLNYLEVGKEAAILTAAVAIIAAAVFFFLSPSHTSVSSISGLGIVLSNFIPLPLSAITMILNIVLLIIGFLTCGREFGAKTVYTSITLPLFLGLFEILFPDFESMTGSQELDVLCYILVVSIGLSILFNRNASSGGLDIVAKILNKYLRMDLGRAMSLSGMCVALSAALVYDKKTVVLSILGTYFNGIILDHFIFDHNKKRRVCIITEKEEALRQFIINELHSGATIYEAIGAYNLQKHNEIITIVDKSEYQRLMTFINREDPKAFITVYNVSNMQYQPKIWKK